MAQDHHLALGSHGLRVRAEAAEEGGTLVTLAVDGREVARHRSSWHDAKWRLADLDTGLDLEALGLGTARVRGTSWRRGRISGVRVEIPARSGRPERIPFTPPPDTRARRVHEWGLAHPRLYAARHVAGATAQIILGIVGISLVIGLVPWGWLGAIPWPAVDLPSIPWPALDPPSVPLPDWTVPAWLRMVMDSAKYWMPILIAAIVGVREYRRRRDRRREGIGDRPAPAEGPDREDG